MTTDQPTDNNAPLTPRRYWWIFGILAIVLWRHPVRILSHWWLNPVLYGLIVVVFIVVTIWFIRRYGRKWGILAVLVFCILLAGWQSLLSASEIGNCQDTRYSALVACFGEDKTNTDDWTYYVQIASLPFGTREICLVQQPQSLPCSIAFELCLWLPILVAAGLLHYTSKHYT